MRFARFSKFVVGAVWANLLEWPLYDSGMCKNVKRVVCAALANLRKMGKKCFWLKSVEIME